ncbi:MAG: Asp23/Gls24 family envelope stress response protein [Marinilabiliales bacterium]|nr:Asp23/Gls24 family envelope stress response protein [Marinilabiliales bacterium]
MNRLFKRGAGDGVRIETEENTGRTPDLYLVLQQDVNIREVSRNVQQNVARAIQEMVGMDIGHVNIHIEDIDYEESEA